MHNSHTPMQTPPTAIRRQAYWICPLPEFCPQEHVASECSSEGQQGVWNEAIAFGSGRLSESSEE
jgi:hypothetical protein